MKKLNLEDIVVALNGECEIKGNQDNKFFSNAKPILEAETDSIVWLSPSRKDKDQLIINTKAQIIICDSSISIADFQTKCFVIVKNPRLSFMRIIEKLLIVKPAFEIHPTAYIHAEAKVHPNSYIGPFTYIGKCVISENVFIFGHNHIYDNVTIGKNVRIHAGTVIGADGFGYERNESGELEKFPHLGGVLIDDDVEIGSNTCIDRGVLGNTWIKSGAKIDNLVHVAHNVIIGKHAAVIANAMIGGSTKIGDYSWVAPSASLRDTITIGRHSTVGLGAVVTKNIPDNEIWTGNPARLLEEFLEIQKKIKKL